MTAAERIEAAAVLLDRIIDWLEDTTFDVTDNLTEHFDGCDPGDFIDTIRYHADTLHHITEQGRL